MYKAKDVHSAQYESMNIAAVSRQIVQLAISVMCVQNCNTMSTSI